MKWKKTTQDLNVEIESAKKTQTMGNLEMKNLETWTWTSQGSFTNKIKETEEKISGTEGMIKEMDTSVKENIKSNKEKKSWQRTLRKCFVF